MGKGWAGVETSFPWFNGYDLPLGPPEGAMRVVDAAAGVFTRRFAHLDVFVNVSAWRGVLSPRVATALPPASVDDIADNDPLRLPVWNTTVPDGNKPHAGLELLRGALIQTVYQADTAVGTYNHGAELAEQNGAMIVSWTNAETNEDTPGERVVFAVLPRGGSNWTSAEPLFERLVNTGPVGADGIIVSADEFLHINGRLYARAAVALCTKCGGPGLTRHTAGRLVRRVRQVFPVQLGPSAWIARSYTGIPPQGHNISLFAESSDLQLREDIAEFLGSAQISMVTPTPLGHVGLSEYSVYQRAAPTAEAQSSGTITQLQLVMLIPGNQLLLAKGGLANWR